MQSNGWNDIGYNFLVDPFGQIFEGRGGGMTRNVIGAHAEGFNTGSVGVAVLGSYGSTAPIKRRAGRARRGCSPGGSTSRTSIRPRASSWTSQGSPTYPAGRRCSSRRSAGTATLGADRVPGREAQGQRCGSIADAALALGGPKLFSPGAQGSVGGADPLHGRDSRRRSTGR